MKDSLTPKQVAKAIGVSEASVKRWCDRGLLPNRRTGGGHRRLLTTDVVVFLRKNGHSLTHPEALGLSLAAGRGEETLGKSRDPAADALLSGDHERFRRIIFELYLAGHSACDICDNVVAPAFHEIGNRWSHAAADVYQERRGCEICTRVMHELRSVLPTVGEMAPPAFGGTLAGDPYTLPTIAVEIALREDGWRADSYGAGHPAETLCKALEAVRPQLFWLSVSTMISPEDFLVQYKRVHDTAERLRIPIAVGGRGLTEDIRRRMQYSTYCDNLQHLVEFAQHFKFSPQRAEPEMAVV